MPYTWPFGFLPLTIEIRALNFTIATLPNIDESIRSVSGDPYVQNGWLWPPTQGSHGFNPRLRLIVPMSHQLSLYGVPEAHSQRMSECLIAALGFLYGILLVPDGWVHLRRVRVDADKTHDYILSDHARLRILESVFNFWNTITPQHRKNLFGILHWHTESIAFTHDFEIFVWQYAVLDACWRLYKDLHLVTKKLAKKPGHAERIAILANEYKLAMPKFWDNGKTIADVRNTLIHEAKWLDQPIGFGSELDSGFGVQTATAPRHASRDEHLINTLIGFNTRLILALIGEHGEYIHSLPGRGIYLLE